MVTHPTEQQLAKFASGDLSAPEAKSIQEHLDSCDVCCTYIDKLPNTLIDILRQKEGPSWWAPQSGEGEVTASDYDPTATSNGKNATPAGPRFRIVKPHARGGLGEVFVAEDQELGREVALKEIRKEFADDAGSRGRFVLEAEITGRLEHPGIVAVYGLGKYEDGRPYYAMRFIKGDTLNEAIERFHQAEKPGRDPSERTLAFRDLLGRFVDVCNAVAYAHSRGILHRDLKPGNIMLGKYGETLVVDWGLAKPVDRSDHGNNAESTLNPGLTAGVIAATHVGSAVGTPAFMSPEQAAGQVDLICPASDIYSLGATLYVLLAGQIPFKDRDVKEVLRKVQKGDFAAPRAIKSEVPIPLDAICRKAMALRREDRYRSALELATDIEQWLADEPVTAWPEPVAVKAGRWMRRHKVVVSGGATALLVGFVAFMVAFFFIRASRDEAVDLAKQKEQLAEKEYNQRVKAEKLAEANELLATKENKARLDADQRRREAVKLADDNKSLAIRESKARQEADRRREQAEIMALRVQFEHYFSKAEDRPDLTLVGMANLLPKASILKDQSLVEMLRLHVAAWSGRHARLNAICTHKNAVVAVALSADGKTVLTGSWDKTARLWDSATGKPIGSPLPHQGEVVAVALSVDGKTALTASRGKTARLWISKISKTGKMTGLVLQHQGVIKALALSADGKTVLAGSDNKTARLWDTATGKPIGSPLQHQGEVVAVALSADGKTALTGSHDRTARIWDTATGKPIGVPLLHHDGVAAVALSADGKTALTGSLDNTARLWVTATGKPIVSPLQHQSLVNAVALSADGTTVLTGSYDHTARLWVIEPGKATSPLLQHQNLVFAVALSADGRIALTGSADKTARLWDTSTGKPIGAPLQHQGHVNAVALSDNGTIALTGSADRTARLWDTATGKPIGSPLQHEGEVVAVALSVDGKTALTGSHDNTARLWDSATGKPIGAPLLHQDKVVAVFLGADGKMALTGSLDNTARLWDTATGKPIGAPLKHQRYVGAVALSADGRIALTGSLDNTARLWDTATGKPIGSPLEHQSLVKAVALSADGKTALTGSFDNTARLWDTATGKPIGSPLQHQATVWAAVLSADGKTALTGSHDRTARIWDSATGKPIGSPLQHQDAVFAVALSKNGKAALTGSKDKTARLWNIPQPFRANPERISLWTQVITGFEVDELTAIHVLDATTWWQRRQRLQELGGPPEVDEE